MELLVTFVIEHFVLKISVMWCGCNGVCEQLVVPETVSSIHPSILTPSLAQKALISNR